jgi:transposase
VLGSLVESASSAAQARTLYRLKRAQQALWACRKGGKRHQRARRRVARLHELIRRQRRNHGHQLSARLVTDYDLLAVEDLRITNMTRSARGTLDAPGTNVAAKAGLNRSILDAGWGQLIDLLTYKAEGAGRTLVRVAAKHTSQTCARCGAIDAASRPNRDHFACTTCGHTAHPDANAAQVVPAIATGRLSLSRPPPTTRPGSGHRDAAWAADRGVANPVSTHAGRTGPVGEHPCPKKELQVRVGSTTGASPAVRGNGPGGLSSPPRG